MECEKCNSDLDAQDALQCSVCNLRYHYGCYGLSEINFKKLSKSVKSSWKCLPCKTSKGKMTSSSTKEIKKESDTERFNKERLSLLNDLEDNSDDVDGDLEMKESNKSDTLTEEETHEPKDKVVSAKVAGNESTASLSSVSATERRSNRIMTRKQRDSELRLQFAKKLKATPQQRPKQALSNAPRRFSKSDLNTSDSEAYYSSPAAKKTPAGGMAVKKTPLPLGNKRKSSLEYAKNRKLMRKGDEGVGDTTTSDENDEDTEESDQKHNNKNAKRKVINTVKKKNVETSDEDEDDSEEDEDSDSDSDTDLEEELKKAISKKFTSYKNVPDSPVKKPVKNLAPGGLKSGSAGTKQPVPRPSTNKPVVKSKQVTITPTRVLTTTMDKQYKSETISNVGNTKLYANSSKNIDSMKIYYPSVKKNVPPAGGQKSKMMPASKRVNNVANNARVSKPESGHTEQLASPKAKSEFDKLVDELFESETTREKLSGKAPEIMLINNEPTDVYTLSIDDTLEDDSDLEALMEEVYEDETTDAPSQTLPSPTLDTAVGPGNTKPSTSTQNATPVHPSGNANTSVKPKPHILNVNSPMISPKNIAPKTSETATKKSNLTRPVSNGAVNRPAAHTPKQISRLGSQVSLTPVNKSPAVTASRKPANASVTVAVEKRVSTGIDYKEKYNKLHTSYEMLSKKIAQYMEKTKQEKDQLKRQLKLERNKLERAQQDIEVLKEKFDYLMKSKPRPGSIKKKVV